MKLLLNTSMAPIYTMAGVPVPSGGVVLDKELADADLPDLVHVRPSDLDDSSLLTEAARDFATRNAETASGDDAGEKKTPSKGGKS